MTIYKSRQVNLDPEPWVDDHGKRHATEEAWCDACGGCSTYLRPRPEFEPTRDPKPWKNGLGERVSTLDGLPHDERIWFDWAPRREQFDTPVNRVLARFRHASEREFVLANLDAYLIGVQGWATSDEIDHARRVLTRLANWKEQ